MHFFGDMTYVKGKVAKKYVEDGEHLVLVNVWGENQDGVAHTKADFVVKLVSKSEFDKAI
jgi:hypothetical protein